MTGDLRKNLVLIAPMLSKYPTEEAGHIHGSWNPATIEIPICAFCSDKVRITLRRHRAIVIVVGNMVL